MSTVVATDAATATVARLLAEAAPLLGDAGIDTPRREARLLLEAALAVDAAFVLGHPDRILTADDVARFRALVDRRAAREPAARLLGHREFWSLDFALSPQTLVPRPDSETVVEAVLATIVDRHAALRLLDLGTGSGCLLAALLSELPAAHGFGVDNAPGAAAMARRNAAALGFADRSAFVVGDWAVPLAGSFDVIVANPPYVETASIAALAPEVARHEPRAALDGGADGLDAYRALAPQVRRLMAPDGRAAFEFGDGQGEAVADLMRGAGLAAVERRRDLAGIERCVVLRRG